MITYRLTLPRNLLLALFSLALVACGGGGGGSAGPGTPPVPQISPTPGPQPTPEPEPTPQPMVMTAPQASRFLSQATFGSTMQAIEDVVATGPEAWLIEQLAMPASLHLDDVLASFPSNGNFRDDRGILLPGLVYKASDSFWEKSIAGEDQLRQRMAFALSQILVVSSLGDLGQVPQTVAAYMDVLTAGAFGNFRDLIEAVTYSPAMAVYLTYLRNQKADPATGRVPDENYAREILQLFTVGLVELGPDGTPATGPDGQAIELFDNDDITGLAKVFTGLSLSGTPFNTPLRLLPFEAYYRPLQMFDQFHSTEEKRFLGTTIPADTGGEESIDLALDAIFAHPNTGPFLSRQLIQRFVTSAPSAAYVGRVAAAFDRGAFTLPGGSEVGTGARGDLAATLAAILFDSEARSDDSLDNAAFGKLREPVLRFTHWARAFEVNSAVAANELLLRDTSDPGALGQHPYRSPSVFNFYRPGYVAPGTETGAAQLTAPELQIANASSIMGYTNFITVYALGRSPQANPNAAHAYLADYETEAALSPDPQALLDHLDLLLTHGTLHADTRDRITQALAQIGANNQEGRLARAQLASIMVMTSPEYIVLR